MQFEIEYHKGIPNLISFSAIFLSLPSSARRRPSLVGDFSDTSENDRSVDGRFVVAIRSVVGDVECEPFRFLFVELKNVDILVFLLNNNFRFFRIGFALIYVKSIKKNMHFN